VSEHERSVHAIRGSPIPPTEPYGTPPVHLQAQGGAEGPPGGRAEDRRPGWAAVRRSLLIALCVGSTIIILNHGDSLLAGAITLKLVVKMLVTPCVPFCVSFYGAYVAYRQALAERQQAAGMV
jgi:hypothetical protein